MWAEYFEGVSLPCAFWSATAVVGQQKRPSSEEEEEEEEDVLVAEGGGSSKEGDGSEVDEEVDRVDVEEMEIVDKNRYEVLSVEGGEQNGIEVGGGSGPPTNIWSEDMPTLGERQSIEVEDQDTEVDGSIHHDQLPTVSGAAVEVDLEKESNEALQPQSLCGSEEAEGWDIVQSLALIEQPETANEGRMQDDGGVKVLDVSEVGGQSPRTNSVLDTNDGTVDQPSSLEGGAVVCSGSEAVLPTHKTAQDKPLHGASQPMKVATSLQSRVLTRLELLNFFRTIGHKKGELFVSLLYKWIVWIATVSAQTS